MGSLFDGSVVEKMMFSMLSLCSGQEDKQQEKEELVGKASNEVDVQQRHDHYIPEEIIGMILSKLPVESILRFKSVCKLWQWLISDPKFDFPTKGRHRMIIRCRTHNYTLKNELHLERTSFYSLENKQLTLLPHLPDQLRNTVLYDKMKMLGSCDGLLLLWGFGGVFLWNPTTGCCREFPKLKKLATDGICAKSCTFTYMRASGLCLDQASGDYKAVFIDTSGRVGVASLRKGVTWDDISFPYQIGYKDDRTRVGVLANGHLHWVVREKRGGPDLIVYFDERGNKFNKLPMPEKNCILDSETIYTINSIHVLNGCLSMIITVILSPYSNSYYDLLIMKEYGVKESWAPFRGSPSYINRRRFNNTCNNKEVLSLAGTTHYSFPHSLQGNMIYPYFFQELEDEQDLFRSTFLTPLCTSPRNAKQDRPVLTMIKLPPDLLMTHEPFTFLETLASVNFIDCF